MSISNAAELSVAREEIDAGLDQLRIGLVGIADIRAASTLPDWSQAQLFAHITGVCSALARQIEFALRGEQVAMYDGGMAGRNQAIATLAAGEKTELLEAFGGASAQLHDAVALVTEADLTKPSSFRGGEAISEIIRAARREVLIHLVDANVGYRSSMLSLDFVKDLIEFLAARVPVGARYVLQPIGMDPKVLLNPETASSPETAGGSSVVISGMLNDLADWLAGREPQGSVSAQSNADSVPLPELLPWPSGIKK